MRGWWTIDTPHLILSVSHFQDQYTFIYQILMCKPGMIQFFACLASILNVLAIVNYRSTRKNLYMVVFYVFSAIQLLNDVFYLTEIYRHLSNGWVANVYPVSSGLIFTYLHLILVALSVLALAFAPLIQKYTKQIKLKPISGQDKDLQ